jgi:hypothetical protein
MGLHRAGQPAASLGAWNDAAKKTCNGNDTAKESCDDAATERWNDAAKEGSTGNEAAKERYHGSWTRVIMAYRNMQFAAKGMKMVS